MQKNMGNNGEKYFLEANVEEFPVICCELNH